MDLICYSHLRWNFVYQRPQHLMSRFADLFRVFYIEETIYGDTEDHYETVMTPENVRVIIPHIRASLLPHEKAEMLHSILRDSFDFFKIDKYIAWFYTPMALDWCAQLPTPEVVIYDCMDELSLFKGAPSDIVDKEKQLFNIADLVFTGGMSLYEVKKQYHPAVFAFPSSIDKNHFGKARTIAHDPADQEVIPHPRIGFFGVIDERMDTKLIETLADLRPDWNFVIIGPIVKIDPSVLPHRENIHYLGAKEYKELPEYLGGWDVAMIPFALNDSTRFISPTKTPEYLAGGVPVVSMPLTDVKNGYGDKGLVYIAANPEEFVDAIECSIDVKKNPGWIKAVDVCLDTLSWDNTWQKMMYQINFAIETKHITTIKTLKICLII